MPPLSRAQILSIRSLLEAGRLPAAMRVLLDHVEFVIDDGHMICPFCCADAGVLHDCVYRTVMQATEGLPSSPYRPLPYWREDGMTLDERIAALERLRHDPYVNQWEVMIKLTSLRAARDLLHVATDRAS